MDIKGTLSKAWQSAKLNGGAALTTAGKALSEPGKTVGVAKDYWAPKINDVVELSIDALTPEADPAVQRKGIGWDPDALTPAQRKNLRNNAR